MGDRSVTRRVEPAEKTMLFADVVRSTRVSPSFQRVTISGEALRAFQPLGYDQWFRLFLPLPGHEDMRLPKKLDLLSYARFLAIPKRERPMLRNYSVRSFRPAVDAAAPELDIDFVLHGDEGYAARWARDCEPGARVALLDEGLLWVPPAGMREFIWLSDETGLPALASTLESLPPTARGTALVEVPDAGDASLIPAHPGVRVEVLVRPGTVAPGELALGRLRELEPATDGLYGFAVGESALATGARRYLVSELGLPKSDVTFCGFWRSGH